MKIDKLVALARAAINRIANEPVLVVSIAIAAINTAKDQSWRGYGVAVIVALTRAVVSGPLSGATTPPGPHEPAGARVKNAKPKVAALLAVAAAFTGVSLATSASGLTVHAGDFNVTKCGTVIDHTEVDGDVVITVGNGHHTIYDNEAAAKADACVTITNSTIKGVVDDKYTGRGFGPVFLADTEIAGNGQDIAALSDTNIHAWRVTVHGNRSGGQCDGYCEIHNSSLTADTEVCGSNGCAHMDAFISNGAYGAPTLLDGVSFLCNPQFGPPAPKGAGCAADVGFFGDFSAITNVTIRNSTFKATNAAFYCAYTGADLSTKPYPHGANLTWTDNVWERGGSGSCTPVRDWSNSAGEWCNNTWSDGGNVLTSPDNCSGSTTTTKASTSTTRATSTTTKPPATTTTRSSSTTVAPVTTTTVAPVPPDLAELRKLQNELNGYLNSR